MSLKFPGIAKYFSRGAPHAEKNTSTSAFNWRTLFSRSPEKSSTGEKTFSLTKFFNKFFTSKAKAKERTEASFQRTDIKQPASVNIRTSVDKPIPSAEEIVLAAASQSHHEEIEIIPETTPHNEADGETNEKTSAPPYRYEDLVQRRAALESDASKFDLDIVNIGTLLRQPQGQIRADFGLDATQVLSDAFQIYYEDGKKTHKNSHAFADWAPREIIQTHDHLGELLSKLGRIKGTSLSTQDLIDKAKVAVRARTESLSVSPQKNKTPGP